MAGEFVVGTLVTRLKMDANDFYKERQRADRYISNTIKQLEHERRVLMWGGQAARDYGLQMAGATKESIAELNKLEKQVESLRKAQGGLFSGQGAGGMFGGIQATFGKGSPLGQFLQILAGGGAIAGISLLARSIENTAEKLAAFYKTADHGTLVWHRHWIQMASGVPILGSLAEAGEHVGTIFGREMNKEVFASAEAFVKLRQEIENTNKAAAASINERSFAQGADENTPQVEKLMALKRALVESSDYRYMNPKAHAAMRDMNAMLERLATFDDTALYQAQERWAEFQREEAERAAEVVRQKELQTLEMQEQRAIAEAIAKEEDAWAERMNKRNRERLAKQTAATIARDNSPAEFDKALREYASKMDHGGGVALVEGSDARSIEATTRVAEHGVSREVDREIQRAMLESNQRQAEELAEMRKALLNYIRDPDAGFRL